MTQVQNIEGLIPEGLIPMVQSLSLQTIRLSSQITLKEAELANLPDVLRINAELAELRKLKREAESQENTLRDQGKQILIDSGMKEFTTLDGTTVALQFTPWALVISEGATVPSEYMRVKTTEEVDKTAIKKAITNGEIFDWIFIQKDAKLVIKQK